MQTRVTGLLKTEYPIIQGGMAWVADYHLAAAVSNGGGLGMIGAANAPAEWVAEQIREVRKRTDRPFGVNIMLMSPHADEVARTVARERVPVVTTGAGNPEQYMTLWKGYSGHSGYCICCNGKKDGKVRSRCSCGRGL